MDLTLGNPQGDNIPLPPTFGSQREEPFQGSQWGQGANNFNMDLTLGNPMGTTAAQTASLGDNPLGGFSAESDAKRKRAGVPTFHKDIAKFDTAANLAEIPHQMRLEDKAFRDNQIANRVPSEQYTFAGTHPVNATQADIFPQYQSAGNFITGRYGRQLEEGGSVSDELTKEQIQLLRDGGYDVQIIG